MDIIIDGYNVIFKISELGYSTEKCDIEVLRNRLLTLLEQYKEKRKHCFIVSLHTGIANHYSYNDYCLPRIIATVKYYSLTMS